MWFSFFFETQKRIVKLNRVQWDSTFFKISPFVFHRTRRKKGMNVWNDMMVKEYAFFLPCVSSIDQKISMMLKLGSVLPRYQRLRELYMNLAWYHWIFQNEIMRAKLSHSFVLRFISLMQFYWKHSDPEIKHKWEFNWAVTWLGGKWYIEIAIKNMSNNDDKLWIF